MSTLYCDQGGFRPLALPATGFELLAGRQYLLSPIARITLEEAFGLRGVPSTIECVTARSAGRTITTIVATDGSSEEHRSTHREEPRPATFKAYMGNRKWNTFTLDLEKVHSLREFYAEAHAVSDKEMSSTKEVKASKKVIDLSILDV